MPGSGRDGKPAIVVCDSLNTHTMGAFYEAFAAAQARERVCRLEFRYAPKHVVRWAKRAIAARIWSAVLTHWNTERTPFIQLFLIQETSVV